MPSFTRRAGVPVVPLLAVLVVVVSGGCGVRVEEKAAPGPLAAAPTSASDPQATPQTRPEGRVTLSVRCGAALQPSMDEIGKAYEQQAGVRVEFTYAGAQMLLGQLAASRSGDLYMPGEAFWVDQAAKRGFVTESRTAAYFLPVLMVPKGNPGNIHEVKDMARPGVRVAIGHPEALAVGPVTKRIMQRVGIWETVQKNVIMQAGCIPELANAVAMKAADAGILWDASVYQVQKHVDALPIRAEDNEVAEVLIATLKFSEHPAEAQAFAHFVTSDTAKAIFAKCMVRTERPAGVRLAPREATTGKAAQGKEPAKKRAGSR
jgi:molybdate transport system substrate-binding protein